MATPDAKFAVGQLVQHKYFGYRGAIFDADATFQGTEHWYATVAKSRPPKDQPWYHVLVDDAEHSTYVAERNLEADDCAEPINHPMLSAVFTGFSHGRYLLRDSVN